MSDYELTKNQPQHANTQGCRHLRKHVFIASIFVLILTFLVVAVNKKGPSQAVTSKMTKVGDCGIPLTTSSSAPLRLTSQFTTRLALPFPEHLPPHLTSPQFTPSAAPSSSFPTTLTTSFPVTFATSFPTTLTKSFPTPFSPFDSDSTLFPTYISSPFPSHLLTPLPNSPSFSPPNSLPTPSSFPENIPTPVQSIDSGASWNQIFVMDGIANHGYTGWHSAMTPDGSSLIIGDPGADSARVFDRSDSSWVQRGEALSGKPLSGFGSNVVISDDSLIVTVGAPYDNINSGYFQSFQWSGNLWVARGGMWTGPGTNSSFGFQLAMSRDASLIVVGAPEWSFSSGYIFTFYWAGLDWQQVSTADLYGTKQGSLTGYALSMTHDGSLLVVGSPGVNVIDVFQWLYGSWYHVSTKAYSNYQALFGWSVSISGDGSTLAVGVPLENKSIIYEWAEHDWNEVVYLEGSNFNSNSGVYVALSDDGVVLAVSAENGSENVQTYERTLSGWIKRGSSISLSNENGMYYSVSLSSDGQIMAVGSPLLNNQFYQGGQVVVYDWS